METSEFIPLDIFCLHHQVTVSFVTQMEEAGWIEIVMVDEIKVIPLSELAKAEKLVRLTNDLQINPEGIAAIMQLLKQLEKSRTEVSLLKERLRRYEEEF